MTIDELYKAFNDIEFQETRLLKAKDLDREHLSRFNQRTEEIRQQLVSMRLNGHIHETMNDLKEIDEAYLPKLSFGRKLLNKELLKVRTSHT